MNRLVPAQLTAVLLAASLHAQADNPGPLEDAGRGAREMAGPLAVSADGRFRVHVDAAGNLRRIALADRRLVQTLPLGAPALLLSASRTAQKVAVLTEGGCIGVADFGAQPPAVTWAPKQASSNESDLLSRAWTARAPERCEGDGTNAGGLPALALSVDGKLLAWRDRVVDIDRHRLVGRLPAEATTLRFVDDDRKLFAGFVASGYQDEGLASPDSAVVAVWDLASGELQAVLDDDHGLRIDATHMFSAYSPATGVAWWVNTSHWQADIRQDGGGVSHYSLRLDAARPGSCGAAAQRARLEDAEGDALVIDPFGRWAATIARLGPDATTKIGPDGSALQFFDLASGRRLQALSFPFQLRGAVASADGDRLFALAAAVPSRETGVRAAVVPGIAPGAELREIPAPASALATRRDDVATAWTRDACRIEDEEPGARRVARAVGTLARAWSMTLSDPTRTPAGDAVPVTFVRPDGSLWLARAHDLAQLEPATGRPLRTLPLPAGDKAVSRYDPRTDGFVNVQGDTVTWRAAGGGGRRLIDSSATLIVDGFDLRGRLVLVSWAPKPGAPLPKGETGMDDPYSRRFVFYDVASGRRVSEQAGSSAGANYATWDELSRRQAGFGLKTCHDQAGAIDSGFDWRIDMLDTVRAWRCQSSGARTVFWEGTQLQRDPATGQARSVQPRQVLATDGPLAVVYEDNRLRVFDAAARSELGSIEFGGDKEPPAVTLSAAARLLLVQADTVLTAYRLP